MFTLDVFQNPYLPKGHTRVDAIMTVATDSAVSAQQTSVEGFILDVSGSMAGNNIERTKYAARKAIQMLDASVHFFVVVFSDSSRVVLPLVPATPENKSAAEMTVQRLEATGGTCISEGLAKARGEFGKMSSARGHALFLTDGKNSPDDTKKMRAELLRCQNVFQADCRGVGTDWEPAQLREIADALMGTAQIIADPAGLEADFRETLAKAMSRSVGHAQLRVVTPKSGIAKLAFMKQMSPAILDLTSRAVCNDRYTFDFPTGAWAPGETRDFHIAFDVPPGTIGDEMLVCRTSIRFGNPEQTKNGAPVLAAWTQPGDERSALINPQVAHYTGQAQLAQDISEGLAARARGDIDAATQHLTRAAKMAQQSGNSQVTNKLREVIVENPDGTINLRANVQKAKVMDLDLGSIITSKAPKKPTT